MITGWHLNWKLWMYMQNNPILVLLSLLKSGTDDYFSFNWILVKIDRCLRHARARQNTYYRRDIKYYGVFLCVFFWNVAKAETEQWGKKKTNKMTKTDFIREQVNIKMFIKLILQLKSDRISFTILMIRYTSGCQWK
jgi:hypothetical protein